MNTTTTIWLLNALDDDGCLVPIGAYADPRKALEQARELAPGYGYEGDTRDLIVADGDKGPADGERELLLKDEDTCLFVVMPIGLTA